jgi:hypothetical protein
MPTDPVWARSQVGVTTPPPTLTELPVVVTLTDAVKGAAAAITGARQAHKTTLRML